MIKEGDFVIAKIDSVLRVIQVWKDRPLYLGKNKIFISSVIGHPYGSFFEIKGGGKLCIKAIQLPTELSLPNVSSTVKDNRSLLNSNDTQKLSTNDIEGLKSGGMSGAEIVKIIVENSCSFDEKSLYSQEKYLKKKQMKYMSVLQVLKPNTRLLAETFYNYSPQKICNLRIDSLAQMLTFCNVLSTGKYIVVDSVLGLLTGAVLERIGKVGFVLQLVMCQSPASSYSHAVDALNFSKELLEDILLSVDYEKTLNLVQSHQSSDSSDDLIEAAIRKKMLENANFNIEKYKVKQEKFYKARDVLLKRSMDGLLIAIKHHPMCALDLLDYLAFSRPFTIFSMYQEPLIECYAMLKTRGDIIMLNLSSTWLRKYQILPERTHPEYSMSTNGGFLLTGIKVEKKL